MAGIGGTHPQLTITLDTEATPWSDLMDKPVVEAVLTRVGGLPRGMKSGAASVFFLVEMPDGTQVICETSWAILATTAHAFAGRYGWPE